MRSEAEAEERAELEVELAALEAEIEHLETTIPASWEEVYSNFSTLSSTENKARSTYRRNADASVEAPTEVLAILHGNQAFAALEAPLRELRSSIENLPEGEAMELVEALERQFREVEGAGDVKSPLGKARRALKGDSPDREKALGEYEKAIAAYEAQVAWRGPAEDALGAGLSDYMDVLRGTLGLRQEDRFNREQALFMARCNADHRDISLQF